MRPFSGRNLLQLHIALTKPQYPLKGLVQAVNANDIEHRLWHHGMSADVLGGFQILATGVTFPHAAFVRMT